jgi:hypothetical protein
MQVKQGSGGKLLRQLLAAGAFLSFAFVLGFCVYSLELDQHLDSLCVATQWQKCSQVLDFDYRFWNTKERLLLKQYFTELAMPADSSSTARLSDLQLSADGGTCADSLRAEARTLEYDQYLPHLAEAYIRCAVGVYRHRFDAERAEQTADQFDEERSHHLVDHHVDRHGDQRDGHISDRHEDERLARRLSLVKGLQTLSELYRNHGKTFIAERAIQESRQLAAQR